jgi:hypothetical protein
MGKSKITTDNILEYVTNSKSLSTLVKSIHKNQFLYDYVINLTSFLNEDSTLMCRLYHVKNDISTKCICSICNTNNLIWDTKHNHYRNWCDNNECKKEYRLLHRDQEKLELSIKKRAETNSTKTEEEKQLSKIRAKQTNIERYGFDSYAKTKEFKDVMIDKFGGTSPFSLKETHDKSKQTLIERTGYDHNFKIPEVKERRRRTFNKNYGTNTPSENPEIKQKIIDTNNKLYGANSAMCNQDIQDKSKSTLKLNYNVDSPLQHPDLLKKYEDTMFERYGYRYWLQDPHKADLMLNLSRKYKKYILQDNRTINLQGYEDYAFFEILLNKYELSDIYITKTEIADNIGKIFYVLDDKQHRYYPDFFVKSVNKIIEVKCEYTYNKDLEINKLKQQVCIDLGFDFEFLIIDKDEYKKWNKQKHYHII